MKLERDELAAEARAFVESVLESALLDLKVEIGNSENGIKLDISGEDKGLLLADNARLLYALNHLVNQIYYRKSAEGCNFMLDSNNYREDRATELELMAEKAAEKVRLSGMKVSMQPMPSSERRIIHLALAEIKDVETLSEGSGRYRRVLIVPAD